MVVAEAATGGGPNWTDVLTAVGTVSAAVVAVGIALWTEYRSGERLKGERARSEQQLAEQRELENSALEDERAYSRAQLEEERRIVHEREQLLRDHQGRGPVPRWQQHDSCSPI
jgi:hypothetical protein